MGYASRAGRAIASSRRPVAFAVCDRCGTWFNHNRLHWQHEFSGNKLINIRLLVCRSCLDVPQEQLKARNVPADPMPIRNPRPEAFFQDETTFIASSTGALITTATGDFIAVPD